MWLDGAASRITMKQPDLPATGYLRERMTDSGEFVRR